jgi:hypothetical protein
MTSEARGERAIRDGLNRMRFLLAGFALLGLVVGGAFVALDGMGLYSMLGFALAAVFAALAVRSAERSPLWIAIQSRSVASVHFAPKAVVHATPEKARELYAKMGLTARFQIRGQGQGIVLRIGRSEVEHVIAMLLARQPQVPITFDDGVDGVFAVQRAQHADSSR